MHLHTFFAIGVLLVALVSYLAKSWWLYQLILCTLTVPFILCCWMFPETPLWLLSEGRYKEAQGIVDTMAMWNESSSCDLVKLLSLDVSGSRAKNRKGARKLSLADLFYYPDVAKRTLTIWLVWITINLGYYTFSIEAIRKREHEYLYLFILGKWEIHGVQFLTMFCLSVKARNNVDDCIGMISVSVIIL